MNKEAKYLIGGIVFGLLFSWIFLLIAPLGVMYGLPITAIILAVASDHINAHT